MIKHLALTGIGPQKDCTIDCAQRLNIITGDNGLGKTRLLDAAWWCLTQNWPGEEPYRLPGGVEPSIEAILSATDESTAFHFRSRISDYRWQTEADPETRPGIVVFFDGYGSVAVWDSLRNIYPREKSLFTEGPDGVMRINREDRRRFGFDSLALWNGLYGDKKKKNVYCNGLLRDWQLWQQEPVDASDHEHRSRFEVLQNLLETLSAPGETMEAHAELIRMGTYDVPAIRFRYGFVPIPYVSAGVKRIVEIAYVLLWTWFEHKRAAAKKGVAPRTDVVILIDEIELHLHPKWQRTILPSLLKAINDVDAALKPQFFVTTHAPLVMASLEPVFDQDIDSIFVFSITDENGVELGELGWSKMGDANAWLESASFGFVAPMSTDADLAIKRAEQYMNGNKDLDAKQIEKELLAALPSIDPFLVRWHLFRGLRGRGNAKGKKPKEAS